MVIIWGHWTQSKFLMNSKYFFFHFPLKHLTSNVKNYGMLIYENGNSLQVAVQVLTVLCI